MKKILIVDDTQANLDAAKAFFSNIPGYEFVFATNRKEASALLPDVDAVITDRSLPYSEDSLLGCTIPDSSETVSHRRYEGGNPYIDQVNGYHIMCRAYLLGKPVVMVSEHGSLNFLLPNISNELSKSQSFLMDEEYKKSFSLEKLLDDVEKNPRIEFCNYLFMYGQDAVIWSKRLEDTKKTNGEAWRIAWTELQKQF